jgi:hypothetical protein
MNHKICYPINANIVCKCKSFLTHAFTLLSFLFSSFFSLPNKKIMTNLFKLRDTARHCATLRDTARHCATLRDTARHCATLRDTARHCATLSLPCTFKFLLMCTLLLFFDSNLATAQSNQLIISTKGPKIAMNPHLHGVDRNHYVGYFGDGWKENMYDKKIEMYDAIQNNFAEKKGPIYRIGHNVTDGNAGFEAGDYNLSHPGWHWATKYGNGFNEEYFSTIYTTNTTPVLSSFGLLNTAKTTTTRLGAGVRRYCYVA